MVVHHYTDAPVCDTISPEVFGKHSWTRAGARQCPIKRAYFYINPDDGIEWRFKSMEHYQCQIEDNAVYDLDRDAEHVKQADLAAMLETIIKQGYKAARYGNVLIAFVALQIIK